MGAQQLLGTILIVITCPLLAGAVFADEAQTGAAATQIVAQEQTANQEAVDKELPVESYELVINGQKYTVELSEQQVIPEFKKPRNGQNRVSIHISPTQRAVMNALKFRYPYPARAFDDGEPGERTIRIYHEMGFAMLVTDYGGPLKNPQTSVPKIVDLLKQTIAKELQGKLENPQMVSDKFEFKTKNGTQVSGVSVQLKLSDTRYSQTVGMTLSNPDFFATVTIQLFGLPFENVRTMVRDMVESFEKR